jgi:hypothetical protein
MINCSKEPKDFRIIEQKAVKPTVNFDPFFKLVPEALKRFGQNLNLIPDASGRVGQIIIKVPEASGSFGVFANIPKFFFLILKINFIQKSLISYRIINKISPIIT